MKNNRIKSTSAALLLCCMTLCGLTVTAQAQDVISFIPGYASHLLKDRATARALSPEARAIIERPVDIYTDGRMGSAALFAPLIFDLSKVPALAFPYDSIASIRDLSKVNTFVRPDFSRQIADDLMQNSYSPSRLNQIVSAWTSAERMRESIFMSHPNLITTTTAMLPKDRIDYAPVEGAGYSGELAISDVPQVPTEEAQELAVSVNRKYWIQRFEVDAHFAQNQVSPNWHKGGQNSLNLNTRLFYDLTYSKDRVKWVNNIEYKLGLFTSTSVSNRKLQISEDMLRFNSNFGVMAYKNWFYTVDLGIRTQLLQNWSTDSILVTRPFAPIIADAGIGMKYDIDKKQYRGDPFARFRFNANFAPLSAQMIYTWADDIDKGRVGLQPDQNFLFRLGSSVRVNLIWDFSSIVTWSSRFLYNTSYKHVETELENTLTYALTQYLSTKININLRYDDSVILEEPKTFKNLLQFNELFSFGFAYKL